jgi:hypothetical protein
MTGPGSAAPSGEPRKRKRTENEQESSRLEPLVHCRLAKRRELPVALVCETLVVQRREPNSLVTQERLRLTTWEKIDFGLTSFLS